MARGGRPVTSWPLMTMRPDSTGRRPVRASTNSVWPLPCTPAMPRISPARTLKETPSTATRPRSSSTRRSSTRSTSSPGWAGRLSTVSNTSRPTIMAAREASVAWSGVVVPTSRPARNTLMRSATASTSLSLWVMKMMLLPWAAKLRMTSKRSSASWGVSTEVGSSRMRMSAPR